MTILAAIKPGMKQRELTQGGNLHLSIANEGAIFGLETMMLCGRRRQLSAHAPAAWRGVPYCRIEPSYPAIPRAKKSTR